MRTILQTTSAIALTVLVASAAIGCRSRQAAPKQRSTLQAARITAAALFTQRYATSRLASWHLRAGAAGSDCAILFVDVPIVLDDSMVEALHYGAGAYDVYDGGIQRFYRQRTFRGVAYKDASGRVWTYGEVSHNEAASLVPCQNVN